MRDRRKGMPPGVSLLGAVMLLAVACASVAPPEAAHSPQPLSTLPPAAKPGATTGGMVTIYSALGEAANSAIVAAFQKAQPVISLEILSLAAAGDLQTYIRNERSAPRADVFLGGSSEFHDPLGKEGLLEVYRSAGAAAIDPEFKDTNGRWTGWYVGVFGILLNTERWAAEFAGIPKPATWDDILAPKYGGAISVPDPVTTGGGYIFLADQVFRFDRDEIAAMEYMQRLHRNVSAYTGTALQSIDRVASGQDPVGLNWGHDVLTAAGKGQPVEFIAPRQTAIEIGAVSIVKGGPNPVGARAFVDWVLSREAAQLIVSLSNRLSVLKRVDPPPGVPTLDQVSLVNYDRPWATENRARLLRQWQAAVGR